MIDALSEMVSYLDEKGFGSLTYAQCDQAHLNLFITTRFATNPADAQAIFAATSSGTLSASLSTIYTYLTSTRSPALTAREALGYLWELCTQFTRSYADTHAESAGRGYDAEPSIS